MTSMEALNKVMGIVKLLGLAIANGMSVWVTFISNYILAGQLPRQQFRVVQSKIYPVYFRAMPYSRRGRKRKMKKVVSSEAEANIGVKQNNEAAPIDVPINDEAAPIDLPIIDDAALTDVPITYVKNFSDFGL
ncbi:hypothetical protein PVK06_047680 [Gossypium arboreum]|uniref:TMEM205-like domain-containing protein n=1 Tax=Gossypium arboreum TaxID=29729 RepID=A0ABR0ME85_GOSAR|nr:hypothetical protein PVK06_047680 [Gossypium arboreum]